MSDIASIFVQEDNTFTVFVVEQLFAIRRGHDFFHSYINKPNYFQTDAQINKRFRSAVERIEKRVTPVAKLTSILYTGLSIVKLPEMITTLSKLFTVHEHQVAGPEIIDPIILQEGQITQKSLSKIININKDSILQPSIIIILKDNDFDRAEKLLSECPDGMTIKMIRNNGKEKIYKVVNCGADNIESFLDSFSRQCYSTCSKTNRDLLLNEEWTNNPIIAAFSPILLRIRTNLLFDEKDQIRNELSELINNICNKACYSPKDKKLLQAMECTAKLFRVFCRDYGGQDIIDAEKIATKLENDVLLAHVYRYAEFLPNCSDMRKDELYQKGRIIFKKYSMEDHAIYCENNRLVQQFYSNCVIPEQFKIMQEEAVNSVPGMVGMSHIYNNVGIAYLFCGHPEIAIDFFNKGLDYAKSQYRTVQNLALESNKMIAESYSFTHIEENRIRLLVRRIFDGMGTTKLPFLSADYILNILAIAYKQNSNLGDDLINTFPIKTLLNNSFATNKMGSGERMLQMQYLSKNYSSLSPMLNACYTPRSPTEPMGRRKDFILQYGLSPFDFNTWL